MVKGGVVVEGEVVVEGGVVVKGAAKVEATLAAAAAAMTMMGNATQELMPSLPFRPTPGVLVALVT